MSIRSCRAPIECRLFRQRDSPSVMLCIKVAEKSLLVDLPMDVRRIPCVPPALSLCIWYAGLAAMLHCAPLVATGAAGGHRAISACMRQGFLASLSDATRLSMLRCEALCPSSSCLPLHHVPRICCTPTCPVWPPIVPFWGRIPTPFPGHHKRLSDSSFDACHVI